MPDTSWLSCDRTEGVPDLAIPRQLHGWCWLDMRHERRVIGFDAVTGGVVITSPLAPFAHLEPPRWATLTDGSGVLLHRPGPSTAAAFLDAVDRLRSDSASGLAGGGTRIVPWSPLPRHLPDPGLRIRCQSA